MDAADAAGNRFDLLVRIGLPEASISNGYPIFECTFELSLADVYESYTIGGLDEIEALYLAYLSVGSIITELREEYAITWHGEPSIGLPNAGDPMMGGSADGGAS